MGLAEELGIGHGITAVIGSGGKTSLLDALARELDGTVVLTTTTHVLPFGCPVLTDADERAVEQALWYSRVVCVGTPTGDGSGKLAAPRLKMRTLSVLADYVLVEADGAARHPLKAHARLRARHSRRRGPRGAGGGRLRLWPARGAGRAPAGSLLQACGLRRHGHRRAGPGGTGHRRTSTPAALGRTSFS
jgi:hypothetical protein